MQAVDPPAPRRYRELDGKTFLICVGGAKCATSWVHHYLAALPEVTVSPLKELHFFDMKFASLALGDMDEVAIKRVGFHLEQGGDLVEYLQLSADFQASVDRMQMVYDDNAYFGHFARLCTPETRAFCDITPGYSAIGPDGFAYLRDFCATQDVRLKLLFLMRDPVERLWSQLRHLQQMNPAARLAERWAEAIESPRICARSDYRGIVSDLDATFPADDILYLFYEELFTEPALRRLCDFAGIGFRPGAVAERKNRTTYERELPGDARAAFMDLLAPQYAFCRERFGAQVPASWPA